MKAGLQRKLARNTGLSESFISLLLRGKKRPSWSSAKKIAENTKTKPELWLDGTPDQIRDALTDLNID